MSRPVALTQSEIQAALPLLPEWKIVERTPAGSDHAHTELHREFPFQSFSDAIHFMQTASRFINVSDHHPTWRNTYSKVEVWLTTGELKHKLSAKDVVLAEYLDKLFQQYQSPNS